MKLLCEIVDWIRQAQDWVHWCALVNTVIKCHVPQNTENFLNGFLSASFSTRTHLHGDERTRGIALQLLKSVAMKSFRYHLNVAINRFIQN
jgi:hypothetical protein